MFHPRPYLRGATASSLTPLSSAFCDRVNRRHPMGALVAVLSTLGGVVLVLVSSF